MSRKIYLTIEERVTRAYEIDLNLLVADDWFEDTDTASTEALADRFEDWLVDEPQNWSAPWARDTGGGEGERNVYEIELSPPVPAPVETREGEA